MVALNAPKLSGQDTWYLRHQILAYKQGLRGVHEQDTYGKEMAPMVLPLIDEAAVENVIAYIGTLPDDPAPLTVEGDIHRGASLYNGCTVCHGSDGGGSYGTFAPRLAGMTDWYMVRQLQNFREGIRGSHRTDNLGKQMGMMSKQLGDDEAINDVVAYINTMSTRTAQTAMHTIEDRGDTDGG